MAGVLDLPTLIQRVRLDADTKTGEENVKSASQRIGSSMMKVGAGLTAGLTVPIVGLAVAGVKAASDLGESASKVGVVFAENSGQVKDFAKTAASSLGISEQAALEATGTFGNLFSALGIGTKPAADMSQSLVTLASDLASFNNADPQEVLLALRSGLLGEAEPLRKFGVSLSAVRIEAEALTSGLVKPVANMEEISRASLAVENAAKKAAAATKAHGAESIEARTATAAQAKAEEALAAATKGTVPELTAAQKAQAAYAIIQKDTTLAQGDFARTSGGLANQQRILAANFENVKATLGQSLLPVITGAASAVNGLLQGFQGLSPEGQKVVKIVLGLAAVLGPTLIILGKFASSFNAIKTATSALAGGQGLVAFLGPALPILAAVAVAAGAAYLVFKNWDTIGPIFESVKNAVVGALGAVISFVTGWATAIGDGIQGVVDTVRYFADTFVSAFKFGDAGAAVGDFSDVIANFAVLLREVWDGILGYVQVIWPQVSEAIGHAMNAVRDIVGVVTTVVGKAFEIMAAVIGPVVNTVFGLIKTVVEVYMKAVRFEIETVLAVVKFLWKAWGDDLLAILKTAWAFVQNIVQAALEVVKGIIQTVLAVINGDWGKAWSGIKEIFRGIWDGIVAYLSAVTGIFRSVFAGFISTIQALWSGAWDAVKGVLSGAWNAIYDVVVGRGGDVIEFFRGLPGRIIDTLSGLATSMFNIGKDILQGLVGGVGSLAETLLKKVKDLVTSPVDWVKGFLGIHSPSRLFYGIGENTILGFIQGAASKGGTLQATMADLFKSAVSGVGTIISGIGAIQKRDDALAGLKDAEANLAAVRRRAGALPEEIEKAEASLAAARSQAAAVTLEEEKAILEAKAHAAEADKNYQDIIAAGTATADERRLAQIDALLAQQAVTQAVKDSTAATAEMDTAEDHLTALRLERRQVTDDLHDAERALTDARLEAVSAEAALLTAGQNILDLGRESHDMWRELARRIGLTRGQVDSLSDSYVRLAQEIQHAADVAAWNAAVARNNAAAKPKAIPKAHDGGTVTSAGLVNWRPGEELIVLPQAASVVPLNRGSVGGGAPNVFHAPLIGRQYVVGLQPEDVTKATEEAMEKTVLNWGIAG